MSTKMATKSSNVLSTEGRNLPPPKYECNTCLRTFNRKDNLVKHKARKYPCVPSKSALVSETTNEPQQTASLLVKKGVRSVANQEQQKHQCEFCSKIFARNDTLTRHKLKCRAMLPQQQQNVDTKNVNIVTTETNVVNNQAIVNQLINASDNVHAADYIPDEYITYHITITIHPFEKTIIPIPSNISLTYNSNKNLRTMGVTLYLAGLSNGGVYTLPISMIPKLLEHNWGNVMVDSLVLPLPPMKFSQTTIPDEFYVDPYTDPTARTMNVTVYFIAQCEKCIVDLPDKILAMIMEGKWGISMANSLINWAIPKSLLRPEASDKGDQSKASGEKVLPKP